MAGEAERGEFRSAEEDTLADLGVELFKQRTQVEVRISRKAAAAARDAWARDDGGAVASEETAEGRRARHRAGSLALIGLSIEERGRIDGDYVVVELDAWEVGAALEAADEFGRLDGPQRH
ncbi:MAG: hypothetical protein ABJH68_06865 [Ilumatobacter sp.]|uniref:hypothetical protein n=1 Tax=Ilumatobacter sp. TaxID=1967498 RepID=UPI0032977010